MILFSFSQPNWLLFTHRKIDLDHFFNSIPVSFFLKEAGCEVMELVILVLSSYKNYVEKKLSQYLKMKLGLYIDVIFSFTALNKV